MRPLLFLVATAAIAADIPVVRLDTIFPPSGKIGGEIEVAITGAELDEAKALHFSHPGITAEPKDKGKFLVRLAPDVPAGIYDVRVAGLHGISNPRAFVAGDLPLAAAAAPTSADAPLELALNSAVAGTVTASAAHFFKFTATKGQRVLIRCEAAELDSRLNPVLTLLDGKREGASARRGGLLDFTAPADGAFVIRLHDLTYAGGAEHFYRLSVTTGPHVDFILPPAAKPGAKSRFTVFGRNLPGSTAAGVKGHDGAPLEKLDVDIEAPPTPDIRADGLTRATAAALPGFSWRLRGAPASNAVFIAYATEPVVTEAEAENNTHAGQKLAVPCEIVGQFFPARDTDTFSFDAKKGEIWRLEIISHRLGQPTNPFLLLQSEKADVLEAYGVDTNVGGSRFSTISNDPSARFEVKEDGLYRVRIRDLFGGARNDPRCTYRLVIRRETPDFTLAAVAEPPKEKADDRKGTPLTPLLLAGSTSAVRVVAFRQDGFAGEIELHAEGLPPEITVAPTKIAAGANDGVLLLTAPAAPKPWSGSFRIIGKSAALTREARGGVVRWTVGDSNNEPILPRLTREISAAVIAEATPIVLAPAEEKTWEAAAGAKLEIPLTVTRRPEFKEALKVKVAGAPGLDAVKETDIAADSGKVMLDLAAAKVPPGAHTIYFHAQTKGKFRGKDVTTTVYSRAVKLVVTEVKP